MKRVLAVAWFALRTAYDELFFLAIVGFLWFMVVAALPYGTYWLSSMLFSVPWVTIVAVLVSLIPAPPATAALYYVTQRLARDQTARFEHLWEGFKTYLGLSWALTGLLAVTGVLLVLDVLFYLNADTVFFLVLGLLGLWALAFWVTIQVYLFPLMILQEDKNILSMLKNAVLLALAYPFFSLGILLTIVLATVASVLLFILLATAWMPLITLLNNRALISTLEQVEQLKEQQARTDAEKRGDERNSRGRR